MQRRLGILVSTLVLAFGASVVPSAATASANAMSVVGQRQVVPGSVNRTSINLEASYDARIRIGWDSRNVKVESIATIRNTSGVSIDRVELNTVAPRLGGMTLTGTFVDGQPVDASVSDQTIVVPLGGVLPAGASVVIEVRYAARLKTSLGGSNWMFAKANGIANLYRWLPWVSRRTPFDRPNFGDPFVTPTSPLVRVRIVPDRTLKFATSGEKVATDGPDPDVRSAQRARLHDHRLAELRDPLDDGRLDEDRRHRAEHDRGEPAPGRGRRGRSASSRRCSGRTPTRPCGSCSRRAGTRWSHPPSCGCRTGWKRPATATSSPTRSPTSGSTGWSATTRRASRSPTRRPPTS